MLSASNKPRALTWHNFSTPLLHYLKIGRSLSAGGATFQRPLARRNFITCYTAPSKPRASARIIPHTNLSRSLHIRSTLAASQRSRINGNMAGVETILAGKYPAKAHAKRVVEYIRKTHPNATGTLYLEGQKTRMIEDNDEPQPFRYDTPGLNTE